MPNRKIEWKKSIFLSPLKAQQIDCQPITLLQKLFKSNFNTEKLRANANTNTNDKAFQL